MALLNEARAAGNTGHVADTNQVAKKLNGAWYDVKADFGATGDGSTDDSTAIQAALTAIPTAGGVVFFPPGRYRCSVALVPKANTKLMGTHNIRYVSDQSMTGATSCAIECATSFAGSALIAPAVNTKGLAFDHIALCGRGQGTAVDGIFVPLPTTGELSYSFDNLQISGFTGDGFHGSSHVGLWNNVSIDHNTGWGINIDGSHKMADTKVVNSLISFNQAGGINLDSTFSHGLFDLINVRIERSGGNHAAVGSPLNTNAPGVRIRTLQNSEWTNVSTDANSGHGLDLSHDSAARAGRTLSLSFVNCTFKRDGYGDGTTMPDRAGVYIKGFSSSSADAMLYLNFVNCKVITGKADDAGTFPASYVHPARGLWMENAQFIDWITGLTQGTTSGYHFGAGGAASLWRCSIQDSDRLLMTTPTQTTANRPVEGLIPGSIFFDSTIKRVIVHDGTSWRGISDQYNCSVADQTGFASDTYLTGSNVPIPPASFQAKSLYRVRFDVVKTGAGTAAPVITVRLGTAGTIADTSRNVLTFAAQTAVIDEGQFEIEVPFRTVGSGTTAVTQATGTLQHRLSITGLSVDVSGMKKSTSAGFDSTTPTFIGISVNGGTSASWTVSSVRAQLTNLL